MSYESPDEGTEMMKRLRSVCLVHFVGAMMLGVGLVSCAPPVPAVSPDSPVVSDRPAPIATGQSLPIGATLKVKDQMIELEVAETTEQQAIGLMYRTSLAADRGMLFPFTPARSVGFWMKNVSINLDMVFLYRERVVAIASNVPPCQKDPCPIYGAQGLMVDQVIELRGGRAAELGIRVDDRLMVEYR